MLMILLHHFVVHNAFDVSRMPVSLPKFIFYMLFASGGKIAVVIFFSISAWFCLMAIGQLERAGRGFGFLNVS